MKKAVRKKKERIDRSQRKLRSNFLRSDGLLAETEDAAIKEIIADQIKVAMDKKGLSKTAMAARMKTSRRQLDRLLDPDNAIGDAGDAATGGERGGEEFKGGVGMMQSAIHQCYCGAALSFTPALRSKLKIRKAIPSTLRRCRHCHLRRNTVVKAHRQPRRQLCRNSIKNASSAIVHRLFRVIRPSKQAADSKIGSLSCCSLRILDPPISTARDQCIGQNLYRKASVSALPLNRQ